MTPEIAGKKRERVKRAKRLPIVHVLLVVRPHFGHIREGVKEFEIVHDDRDYNVGDMVLIKECSYKGQGRLTPTGDSFERTIKHILRKYKGLLNSYIVLGLSE